MGTPNGTHRTYSSYYVLKNTILHLIQKHIVEINCILETMNRKAYLDVVKFKNKRRLNLGKLLIFTLIPHMPKMCGLNQFYTYLFKRIIKYNEKYVYFSFNYMYISLTALAVTLFNNSY